MAKSIESAFGYFEGRAIKSSKDAEAEQIERAAAARRAAGTQDAYLQKKMGEKVASDAVAQMAASGGMVEAPILADIHSVKDYNVLSTLFASKDEAQALDYAAKLKHREGRQAKSIATMKTVASFITDAATPKAATGGLSPGGPK